ncbi:hypothetical protein OPT61_g7980 [Boeremia exigua]|uniref:Uncharacterized protein n=1 Tax=Boeremia exigua TaxID=749465 RepID=A0ACC2I0H3_9PLEO|nr:hypothetical protein OPT61_g7980 [Boeremia exigua]
MTIIHIVLFEWKASTSDAQVEEACSRMLALKDKCLSASAQKPYIKSFSGGRNNSNEGHAAPFTHGFVVEFESEEDRDYYVSKDPAHQDFVKFAGELMQSVKVFDYEPEKL